MSAPSRAALGRGMRLLTATPAGAFAVVAVVVLVLVAIIAPLVWSDDAGVIDSLNASQGPSSAHWLGTDPLGRDVLERTLVATRLTLTMAVLASLIGALAGIPIGIALSLLGARGRQLASRAIEMTLAFPPMLVAIMVVVVIGIGAKGAVIATGIAICPQFVRLANSLALSIGSREYVLSARVLGVSRRRIASAHIFPNIGESLAIAISATIASSLVSISALSFLGLGVQVPQYDWGALLNQGFKAFYTNPTVALAPAVALMLAGLAFGMLGEAVARVLNPRAWTQPPRRKRAPEVGGGAQSPAPPPGAAPGTLPAAVAVRADDDPDDRAQPAAERGKVLVVEDLRVSFPAATGETSPVAGVDLTIHEREIVGIVGESGSGKSLTALALSHLIEPPGRVSAKRLELCGVDTSGAGKNELDALLGRQLAVVFQDPLSSLNPALALSTQLTEGAMRHCGLDAKAARAQAEERMRSVRLGPADKLLKRFPHELSGGQRQRAMIAMGLMSTPALIVADEPTTALDVTVQAQIIALLRRIRDEVGASVLLISHNIGVIAQLCDRVLVMYSGRIVEELPVARLLAGEARHPYTRALVAAVPSLASEGTLATIPGMPPNPDERPPGCPYAPRCPLAMDVCEQAPPDVATAGGGHAACWAVAQAQASPAAAGGGRRDA